MRYYEIIRESTTEINGMRAWIDPTPRQLLALAKKETLRGTLVDGHIYVWRAFDETHYGVHGWLVGYDDDYGGDGDFMLGSSDKMDDWRSPDEIQIRPGIIYSGRDAPTNHPIIQALIRSRRSHPTL